MIDYKGNNHTDLPCIHARSLYAFANTRPYSFHLDEQWEIKVYHKTAIKQDKIHPCVATRDPMLPAGLAHL